MSDAFGIRDMTLGDLKLAADWAAAEGWNPGLEDAEAFHGVDPGGFLMGWLGDTPVTAISVVRHSDTFGFLGFYLCHPDHRGKGYGWATWQAGMAHLGIRTVGLDGVPAQEANYARSGFQLVHHTKRYAGRIAGKTDAGCGPLDDAERSSVLAMDRSVSAADRGAYLSAWTADTATRHTLAVRTEDRLAGFGTIRACRQGHKIGPVFAPDAVIAERLIRALVAHANASEVMIDIPDPNRAGIGLAGAMGLEPVFSCARMYRGAVPNRRVAHIFGETTFELG